MNRKGALGRRGEDLTCRYLMEHGHTVLERNWRNGHLEIDIITLAADGIHFVEVKSRVAPVQGEPEDAVNVAKQRRIASAAGRYLAMKGKETGADLEVRFDVSSVTFDGGKTDLKYFPSAFVPIYV